jgi:hypothetical protein
MTQNAQPTQAGPRLVAAGIGGDQRSAPAGLRPEQLAAVYEFAGVPHGARCPREQPDQRTPVRRPGRRPGNYGRFRARLADLLGRLGPARQVTRRVGP